MYFSQVTTLFLIVGLSLIFLFLFAIVVPLGAVAAVVVAGHIHKSRGVHR